MGLAFFEYRRIEFCGSVESRVSVRLQGVPILLGQRMGIVLAYHPRTAVRSRNHVQPQIPYYVQPHVWFQH